jgi:hypothetical protein
VRQFLRRALAIVVAMLIVAESAGAAQAFGVDTEVHCCCGPHSAARKCRCSSCPVSKRHKSHSGKLSQLQSGGDCHPHGDGDGRLVPLSDGVFVPIAPLPPLARSLRAPLPPELSSRAADGERPPP